MLRSDFLGKYRRFVSCGCFSSRWWKLLNAVSFFLFVWHLPQLVQESFRWCCHSRVEIFRLALNLVTVNKRHKTRLKRQKYYYFMIHSPHKWLVNLQCCVDQPDNMLRRLILYFWIVFKCSWEYPIFPRKFAENNFCKILGAKRVYYGGFEHF